MAPRIDIVIICHNSGRYLADAVDSVLVQEGVDVHLLIIDDGSQDESAWIGAQLAARDRRVEFRRHPQSKGRVATCNEGIQWTFGKYSVLLDAEDMLTPGALARAASVMDEHPQIGFAYGRALFLGDSERACASRFVVSEFEERELMSGAQFLRHMREAHIQPVLTPTVVVRTDIQRRTGYRDTSSPGDDTEMWLRAAAHADVCALTACQAIVRSITTSREAIPVSSLS